MAKMIYLDYSATTPVREEVLDSFDRVSREFLGNPNSLHRLGVESRNLMEQATKQVASLLSVTPSEVIFTSSASESNNLALVGLVEAYPKRNRLIVTTQLEHSSTSETLSYLERKGYQIEYLSLKEDGTVDLLDLEEKLKQNPILVSLSHVNSEVGIIQPLKEIVALMKAYPLTFLHVDGTQAIGKIETDLSGIDLYTFSAHKIYGLKGIACLIKKEKVELEPLIHGGKSQTIYRSGTPSVALIVSLAKALRLILEEEKTNYEYVKRLNKTLRDRFKKNPHININSSENASPYILNISIPNVKPETMIHALEEDEIYLSTKTACAKHTDVSLALKAMGKDPGISSSSLRISLSHLTKEEDIETFFKKLNEHIDALILERRED